MARLLLNRQFKYADPGKRRGFTVIEALLALILATLLFGGISLYTGTWLRSWSQIIERGGREDTVATVLDRMVEDIEAAQPIFSESALRGNIVFTGEADRINFLRPALGYGPRGGIDDVTYHNQPAGRENRIVRSRQTYGQSDSGEDLPLMESDARVSFQYVDESGNESDNWERPERLPAAVRITFAGTGKAPWIQSSYARLRSLVPPVCGMKDNVQECMSWLSARSR